VGKHAIDPAWKRQTQEGELGQTQCNWNTIVQIQKQGIVSSLSLNEVGQKLVITEAIL
jgi:hypothetical protein